MECTISIITIVITIIMIMLRCTSPKQQLTANKFHIRLYFIFKHHIMDAHMQVLTATMCVRHYHWWLPLHTRRCHVCYFCAQDQMLHNAVQRLGPDLFNYILRLRSRKERYTEEELGNALE